jgi:hypothetical protein
VREAAHAAVAAIAEADRMDRSERARCAFREETAFDRCDQRLGHGVAAAGTADQQVSPERT